MKRLSPLLLLTLLLVSLPGCKKDKADDSVEQFYGKWKTSYGDTVIFFRSNGKNLMRYNYSFNPTLPIIEEVAFGYSDGKLALDDFMSGPMTYRKLDSFNWLQRGESFTVQGIEWMVFLSSTNTYFTFTKIR